MQLKMQFDHDLHIHTYLSDCSNDPDQNPDRIIQYARQMGLDTVCITDHFWDTDIPGALPFYAGQDFSHISKIKPLPQPGDVRVLFGCEADLNWEQTLGISLPCFDCFDFVIIPTTHLHMLIFLLQEHGMDDAQSRAQVWVQRLDAVLNMPLPFYKVGIAHLACPLIAPSRELYLQTLAHIPEEELYRLFYKAASVGVGIEINSGDMRFSDEEAETVLRPFRIAKACGCKFYWGSDAHHPEGLDDAKQYFDRAVALLQLTEADKFVPGVASC